MLKWIMIIISTGIFFPVLNFTQSYLDESGKLKVFVVIDPYTDSRTGPEQVKGPKALQTGGLGTALSKMDCRILRVATVNMPAASQREYGEWNRASITNKALGKLISSYEKDQVFIIGLLSGSKSLLGMLAGLQHLGPNRGPLRDSLDREITGLVRLGKAKPLKVGLIWIDSRGAFNTPDITLEGDMAGMNVAVAAGVCNHNLRIQAGLDPPLSTKYIVMAGLRDTNPHEQHHIDSTFIETISTEELKTLSSRINGQLNRLSRLTDVIYVHVDLSVLDPVELHGLAKPVPGGISCEQLARCLKLIFACSKTAALGIASPPEVPQQRALTTVYRLIAGAIDGIKSRGK